MPSEELLRRLEALNGGPLRDPIVVDRPIAADPPAIEPLTGDRVEAVVESRPLPARRTSSLPISLREAIPGEERARQDGGRYYHVERLLAEQADWCGSLGTNICAALPGLRSGRIRRSLSIPPPEAMLFVDVETLGLNMHSPIFLIGLVALDGERHAWCRQILAREPDEERAAIAAAAEAIGASQLLVSFNGRGYDMPLLQSRASHFGIHFREPAQHVDMLLEARRRYARKLPNCRLQTLEARVCGRTREDDVPSSRIPGVYRQFVKTGNAAQLQKVFHHNLLDLATTAELFTLFFR